MMDYVRASLKALARSPNDLDYGGGVGYGCTDGGGPARRVMRSTVKSENAEKMPSPP